MTGFSSNQLKKLSGNLDTHHVYKRQRDGRELTYIPGWFAVAEANAIFGYAGWDRETIHLERLYERHGQGTTSCGYLARVRVTVRAGDILIKREGSGFGFGSSCIPAEAHERALKSAETDATKRALATFGSRFGLSLYSGKEAASASSLDAPPIQADPSTRTLMLCTPEGNALADHVSPEGFATGLRQLIEKVTSAKEIDQLLQHNGPTLNVLRSSFPHMANQKGRHFADILLNLAAKRKIDLDRSSNIADRQNGEAAVEAGTDDARSGEFSKDGPEGKKAQAADDRPETESPSSPLPLAVPAPSYLLPRPPFQRRRPVVDKSLLSYASERRIRNKQHLSLVASKPCLICEDMNCHAHHLTFAQPRGLSVKVSDEFTVPLCAIHHNEVHQQRPERAWWNRHGIDATKIAQDLWEETLRVLVAEGL